MMIALLHGFAACFHYVLIVPYFDGFGKGWNVFVGWRGNEDWHRAVAGAGAR